MIYLKMLLLKQTIEFNAKAHKMSAVQQRLKEFAEHMKENKNKTFLFELHKGNTRDILKTKMPGLIWHLLVVVIVLKLWLMIMIV